MGLCDLDPPVQEKCQFSGDYTRRDHSRLVCNQVESERFRPLKNIFESSYYNAGMARQRSILFVCLGNIVRSPLAENIFRRYASIRGLDGKYYVDSAGTTDYHEGEPPDRRMRQEAQKHGLQYSGRSRPITWDDFHQFDLIIALDQHNYIDLRSFAGYQKDFTDKIYLLREFDPIAEDDLDIPDPYYGGKSGFSQTYEMVDRSIIGLLDSLEEGEL
jgi:protein-tyrosine phosphatase